MPMPRRPKPGRALGDLRTELVDEWCPDDNFGLTPFDVSLSAAYDAAWKCSVCSYRWRAPVYSRSRGAGCIKCRDRAASLRRSTPKAGMSLGEKRPDVAKDWRPELNGGVTAFEVYAHARTVGVWCCSECGHRWPTQVANRTRVDGTGTGCPDCARRAHSKHMSSLHRVHGLLVDYAPRVAEDWDPDAVENEGVELATLMAQAAHRAGWKCRDCGHRWVAFVFNRTARGDGCGNCNKGRESTQEVALREFLSARMPVVKGRVPRTDGGGKRPWLVDFLSTAAGVVVEFDGSWWHSERANPGMAVKDARKADDIRSQGFTVVRVREAPLVALHEDDLVVPLGLSGAEIGERVWAHLLALGVGERFSEAS